MKYYTIIGGVNGVGKSSFTGSIKGKDKLLGTIIDVDMIARKNECSSMQAGKIAINRINQLLEKGASFTQETTLSGRRTENTIKRALDRGYEIRLYYIFLDTEFDSIERIKNRVNRGGHDIPKEDVHKRFISRYDDIIKILPYCTCAEIYDNSNGFNLAAEYQNGELIFTSNYHPKWLEELENKLHQYETEVTNDEWER